MKFHARAMILALSLAMITVGWSASTQAEPIGSSAKGAAAPQRPHRPAQAKPQRRGIEVASSEVWDERIPVCVRINCNQIFLSGIGF